MDFGENEENICSVPKWPFYVSALFIFSVVLFFAYLELQATNQLDTWQLITCILASALATILVFIPHLIDRFLAIAFDPANRKDEELHRKTYFDIKEMRNELESFSVKIDKVPTLVDKIVSENGKGEDSNAAISQISNDLNETKAQLLERLKSIEEITTQQPLLPEPDPGIEHANQLIKNLQQSVDNLTNNLDNVQKLLSDIPSQFPEPVIIEKEIPVEKPSSTPSEAKTLEPSEEPSISENEPIDESDSVDESEEENEATDAPSLEPLDEIENEDLEEERDELITEPTDQEFIVEPEEEQEEDEEEIIEEENEASDEDQDLENTEGDENPNLDTEDSTEEIASESKKEDVLNEDQDLEEEIDQEKTNDEELPLDLPDPAETLRKVDAILNDTDPNKTEEVETEETKPKKSSTGTTSVVANVMIGIGNKPFLRGDGPGLSWNEGVPMNFIEIGKWAWSPPRKNAALTVQLYRNDDDPDKSGKIEVKAGEKIEITPDFG